MGKIMVVPAKAISEMTAPVNSYFHASAIPIKPISTIDYPAILIVLKGIASADSENNPCLINKNKTV